MTGNKPFPFEWTKSGQTEFLSSRTPMLAAFELSEHQVSQAMTVTHDEESITTAFLGSLMATYPWCALYGVLPDTVDSCSWAAYSKSGHDPKSESSSGADFALVLRRSDVVSVALFQAKKAFLKSNSIRAVNIFRRKPEKEMLEVEVDGKTRKKWTLTGSVSVQIDHLIRTANKLEGASLKTSKSQAPANSWVHYLGYHLGGVRALHLHNIPQEKIAAAQTGTEAECDIELTSNNSHDWAEVLKSGLNDANSPHWLPMTFEAAKDQLPKLLPLMSLVILDEDSGNGALRFEIEGVSVQEVVVNRMLDRIQEALEENALADRLLRRRAARGQAEESEEKKVSRPKTPSLKGKKKIEDG